MKIRPLNDEIPNPRECLFLLRRSQSGEVIEINCNNQPLVWVDLFLQMFEIGNNVRLL